MWFSKRLHRHKAVSERNWYESSSSSLEPCFFYEETCSCGAHRRSFISYASGGVVYHKWEYAGVEV